MNFFLFVIILILCSISTYVLKKISLWEGLANHKLAKQMNDIEMEYMICKYLFCEFALGINVLISYWVDTVLWSLNLSLRLIGCGHYLPLLYISLLIRTLRKLVHECVLFDYVLSLECHCVGIDCFLITFCAQKYCRIQISRTHDDVLRQNEPI